jgi:hypothetical protein
MGVAEEGVKAVGGVVDAMRGQPLAIANIILNIAFLLFLFYYVSIIAARAQTTVKEMFTAQDNLYKQWGVIVKDQQALTEKTMHCILPEDALKLLQAPPRYEPPPVQRPEPPAPLQRQSFPPRWLPLNEPVEWPKPSEHAEHDLFTLPP